jgi:hypothetical protein
LIAKGLKLIEIVFREWIACLSSQVKTLCNSWIIWLLLDETSYFFVAYFC